MSAEVTNTTRPAVIETIGLSKWYGQVLGLRELSLRIPAGITGLLGPNGAGKSTWMKVVTGEIAASRGEARVLGRRVPDRELFHKIGYASEIEVFFEELTALEFVSGLAELGGMSSKQGRERAAFVLHTVGLAKAMERRLSTYSKGMRQRTKLAQALVHDPEVLLLDEPMTGLDPVGRSEVMTLIDELGQRGRTVVVSSHLLDEVEAMTTEIVVLYHGQLLAQGNIHAIRELIDRHPHRVELVCDKPRTLGACMALKPWAVSMKFLADDRLEVETRDPEACYMAIPEMALELGVKLLSLSSADDNLAAVFRYLTGDRGRSVRR